MALFLGVIIDTVSGHKARFIIDTDQASDDDRAHCADCARREPGLDRDVRTARRIMRGLSIAQQHRTLNLYALDTDLSIGRGLCEVFDHGEPTYTETLGR